MLEGTLFDGTLRDLVADLLQSPPLTEQPAEASAREWYLGLDIGTTGISAVLLNRSIQQLYPIYWQAPSSAIEPETAQASAQNRTNQSSEKQFRLPLAVSLMSGQSDEAQDALIRDFKPYLNLTLPYDAPRFWDALLGSQPVLSWSDALPIPLMTLRQSLQALMASLAVSFPEAFLPCGAVDLEAADLAIALQQLVGVIVSFPTGWSEAYQFNVREALLSAKLVGRPEQILFLEEPIAAMLAAFAGSSQSSLKMPQGQTSQDIDWQGNTLILSAGATQTELALVQLANCDSEAQPSETNPPAITHADFHIRTLAYAGTAIDQDIITQLLYPLLPATDPVRNDLEQTAFPAVGEPDGQKREVLQQRLRRTKAGRSLIETARALKLNLQQQNRFVIQIAQQQTTLLRQDLTTKVLLPYVQRLNRELNALLNQTQVPALNVRQVVCTGGTASLGAITRWLQQKLPNALILQDAYPWVRSLDYIPTCSRIAYGLAALPLYPFALDQAKHQYSDFFLLLELMRGFPDQAMTLDEVLEMLQQRGIDAVSCRSRILAILEGQLPPGLIPAEAERNLLTPQSQQNPEYQAIDHAPFHQETYPDGKAYRIDRNQLAELHRYWELLRSNTYQQLTQPYSIVLTAHYSA
ncbi:hypothetical protein [Leptolyngbya sp. FACHB-711]|uniref:hypothetical protein n=1 Tax=Leptolyngbya sp. FACHB-711 TaxID=2692813 RepID=UPI001682FBD8|nr:hypothetical protein [Leptolyngbya sp. FACHB-711]MBD1849354.1 hypothetical protein [Cyanobacteria bacterium FACHB-502]MBD2024685.1 hypothetical protein [Leptolyngbya sp. FACHB-711]